MQKDPLLKISAAAFRAYGPRGLTPSSYSLGVVMQQMACCRPIWMSASRGWPMVVPTDKVRHEKQCLWQPPRSLSVMHSTGVGRMNDVAVCVQGTYSQRPRSIVPRHSPPRLRLKLACGVGCLHGARSQHHRFRLRCYQTQQLQQIWDPASCRQGRSHVTRASDAPMRV